MAIDWQLLGGLLHAMDRRALGVSGRCLWIQMILNFEAIFKFGKFLLPERCCSVHLRLPAFAAGFDSDCGKGPVACMHGRCGS